MAHSTTVFAQLLRFVGKHDFNRIERNGFQPRRRYRTLSRWSQFAVMVFAQITGRTGLRDMVDQFQIQASRLYHLGAKPVKRSTLADANRHRPAEFYKALFAHLYGKCASVAPKKKFRFKNKLFSLDSSVVSLCLSVFPWARHDDKRGGIRLHTVLDHDGHIPAFVNITEARGAELVQARRMKFPKGSILAFDRGYIDFKWLHRLHVDGVLFVTRMTRNLKYKVMKSHKVIESKGIIRDETIRFNGPKAKNCPISLRRIEYYEEKSGKTYVFMTNILHLCAKTIADIYQERWQIEVFFRWIKQNLKIKTFFGTSENAVLSQIWIALITLLLLAYFKFKSKLGESLSEIHRRLELNLMSRKSFWELFNPPEPKPKKVLVNQLHMYFKAL